jgi:acyl carrier protein
MDEIESAVKGYILQEFLPGEDPEELKPGTPLITAGILDSVATLKLVTFLEDRFRISVEAHEADTEYLNTVTDIVNLVRRKQGSEVK